MKLDTSPEALAEELLGRPYDELDEEEQRILARVMSSKIELDPDELDVVNARFGDQLADQVARVGGSWGFIICFSAVLLAWMLVNSRWAEGLGITWDAYPYIFLNLMLSTLAALQAPVIMMSQNRKARKDHISNRHDYEVNLRTTVEILRLHRKVDRIFNKLGQLGATVEEAALTTEAAVEMAIEADAPPNGRHGQRQGDEGARANEGAQEER